MLELHKTAQFGKKSIPKNGLKIITLYNLSSKYSIAECQLNSLVSQWFPLYGDAHSHLYPAIKSMHVPLLVHGLFLQSSVFTSQFLPSNPFEHTQLKTKVLLIWHLFIIMHSFIHSFIYYAFCQSIQGQPTYWI